MSSTATNTNSTTDNETATSSTQSQSSPTSNLVSFFISVAIVVGFTILYFIFGSAVLYGCKIAQSSVLPTESLCAPYTTSMPKVKPIWTNIFIKSGEPSVSMKLSIPYNKANQKNTIIDLLRKYKTNANSTNIGNYFASIFEDLLSFNYSWLSNVLNLLNNLPEMLILLIGPLVVGVVALIMFVFENLYMFYLWFANMSWFFKDKQKVKSHNNILQARWDNMTILEWFDIWWACTMVFIFFILFFVFLIVFPFVFPMIPFITLVWALFSLIGYEGVMNNKNVGFLTILKDTLKYYKILFMTVVSLFAALNAFSKLGTIPGIFCLVVVACTVIFGTVFKDKPEVGLTPLVSTDPALRICNPNESKGFFEALWDCFFGSQQGGKKIISQIKHAGKLLQNPSVIAKASSAPAPATSVPSSAPGSVPTSVTTSVPASAPASASAPVPSSAPVLTKL